MHRFFVAPECLQGGEVAIGGAIAHQLYHVLRAAPGDEIVVLDNSGWEHRVALTQVGKEGVRGAVRGKKLSASEPRTRITLYQAVVRSEKFALVLQKCTEVGVVGFVPVLCERSIIGSLADVDQRKLERWEAIIREAAEQSGRAKLPRVAAPLLFREACQRVVGAALLGWEGGASATPPAPGLRPVLRELGAPKAERYERSAPPRPFAVNLFIGPEGGFSPEEVELARSHGLRPVSFGPRILRTETAAVAAATMILYEWGDLGG
jgi:16S rRNA (uracil1498-N3)-methyltransferase